MKNIFAVVFLVLSTSIVTLCEAQCAVCAAGAASTARTNAGYGAGINEGILYMLTITYSVFAIAGIYLLRRRIRYYARTASSRWRMFIASF